MIDRKTDLHLVQAALKRSRILKALAPDEAYF
jgi:hypothetical protein